MQSSVFETEMPETRIGMFLYSVDDDTPFLFHEDGTPKTKDEVIQSLLKEKHEDGQTEVTADDIVLVHKKAFNDNITFCDGYGGANQPNKQFQLIWGMFKNGGGIPKRSYSSADNYITIIDADNTPLTIKSGKVQIRFYCENTEHHSCCNSNGERSYLHIFGDILEKGILEVSKSTFQKLDEVGESILFKDLIVLQDGKEHAIEGSYKFELQ